MRFAAPFCYPLRARFGTSHLAAGVCRCVWDWFSGCGVCEELVAMKDNKVQALAMRAVDAAKACGVSERTFAGWLKSDSPPPHFKRGGCVLVPTRELQEWLSGQISNGATK